MADFEMTFLGEDLLQQRLSRFADDVKDYRPFWPTAIDHFRINNEEQFETLGQGQWPALSPKYAEWKSKNYPGMPMMQRTGRLIESLTGETKDTLVDGNALTLKFGTKVPYAAYHQKGGSLLPMRKVVAFTPEQKRDLMKELQRYVVKLAKK